MLLLTIAAISCKTRKLAQPSATLAAPANFRVVGYMLSGEIAKGQTSNFDISKLF